MTGTAPDSDTTPATPASVSASIAPAAGDRTNRTNGNRTTTSVALLLIRLRWTLTIAALRHSPQRIVAMIIAVIGALGLIAAAISGGIALGARPDMTVGASAWNTFHTGVVLGGAGTILAVLLIQLMYVGQASAMDPRKFELFGIPDRELTRGLFAAGLCGIPAISGTLALLAFASAYRRAGGVVVVVALLAAPIAIVVMLALSKAMIALFSALADSRRARGRSYLISMPVVILACQRPKSSGPRASPPVARVPAVRHDIRPAVRRGRRGVGIARSTSHHRRDNRSLVLSRIPVVLEPAACPRGCRGTGTRASRHRHLRVRARYKIRCDCGSSRHLPA